MTHVDTRVTLSSSGRQLPRTQAVAPSTGRLGFLQWQQRKKGCPFKGAHSGPVAVPGQDPGAGGDSSCVSPLHTWGPGPAGDSHTLGRPELRELRGAPGPPALACCPRLPDPVSQISINLPRPPSWLWIEAAAFKTAPEGRGRRSLLLMWETLFLLGAGCSRLNQAGGRPSRIRWGPTQHRAAPGLLPARPRRDPGPQDLLQDPR